MLVNSALRLWGRSVGFFSNRLLIRNGSTLKANVKVESLKPSLLPQIFETQQLLLPLQSNKTCVQQSQLIPVPLIMPTKQLPVISDYTLPSGAPSKVILEPLLNCSLITPPKENPVEIVEPLGPVVEKLAAHMITIRHRKMKKHKLRKLRKRMKFVWAKLYLKRSKLKEEKFKAELLAQIMEAQAFDAEKFVNSVLHRIRNKPRPPTPEERYEEYLELLRKHKSNVLWIKPKFE